MSRLHIDNPSNELIEAAEACGLYCFGHPDATQTEANIALSQDQDRRQEQRRTLGLRYGQAK